MAEAWTFAGESAALHGPGGTVTLVEGSSFCISGRSGDTSAQDETDDRDNQPHGSTCLTGSAFGSARRIGRLTLD